MFSCKSGKASGPDGFTAELNQEINLSHLQETSFNGGEFTWSNNQVRNVFKKSILDKTFNNQTCTDVWPEVRMDFFVWYQFTKG